MRTTILLAILVTSATFAPVVGSASETPSPTSSPDASGPSPIGHVSNLPCSAKLNPFCPDYTSLTVVGPSWKAPASGYRGLATFGVEHSDRLNRDVGMFFFRPEAAATDGDKVQTQALAIVQHLQDAGISTVDMVIGRAYAYDGNVLKLDGYIFLKDASGVWQRNHDYHLVDQVIEAQL